MNEGSETAPYRDASLPVDRRVADLLSRMTLAEKAAQLGSVNADRLLEDGDLDREAAEDLLADGIGHLTRIGGEGSLDPEDAARVTNELQSILQDTRLGVPAIPHEECLSGYMGPEGTTVPQGIGLASTWNPDLVESVTETIREQLLAIGTAHALSPVFDLARDLRWGRVEETFGEDAYLAATMGCAYVDGLQGEDPSVGISATPKHFVGHGAGEGGKNRSSVDLSPRRLREDHMFPFEAAVRTSDAESIMNAYHDIDGIPCAAAEWLLTDVLRGEWDFDGHVVSDYYSVDFLRTEHGVADDQQDAGVQAVAAGIDVELPATDCYEYLADAVRDGDLAEETLDAAVRRVLRAKFRKGLFDDPTVDAEAAREPFEDDAASDLAREAARQSIVLLDNDEGLLPLADPDSVAVLGPKADDRTGMLGDYAYAAHYPEEEYEMDAATPLDAIEARVDADVTYEQGCTATGPSTDGVADAVTAAEEADVALAFVGARSAVDFSEVDAAMADRPTVPTSGEGRDVTDLGLPGVQADLVDELLATDTPVVVVLVSGKPHAIPDIADRASAVVEAWLPGEEGGHAVVDVLFEGTDPGGRLPVSFPKSVGQIPVHYSRKPYSSSESYVYQDGQPVYAFGHGESYADFEYGDLELSTDAVDALGTVDVAVTVTNEAERRGSEVVQLYASAESPSLARPVQELVGFQRVDLAAGESRRVRFDLSATQLAYHDRHETLVVEDGDYELRVGRSSTDLADTATLTVTETADVPHTARRFFTDVTVEDA